MATHQFTDDDYVRLNQLLSGGDISACTKLELERFAVMLSRPNAYAHFGANGFLPICNTVRTLILVRMSEEQNVQAQKESRLALIIACVALVAGIVQAVVSYLQFVSSAPVMVKANNPLPVMVAAPIPVNVIQTSPLSAQVPEPKPQAQSKQSTQPVSKSAQSSTKGGTK